ncbi:MAG: DUF6456 domain-containing protein [Pseudomonadota bacterium]
MISERLRSALDRGAVAVRDGAGWRVHRGPDLRRRAIGWIDEPSAEALLVAGRLQRIEGRPNRLIGAAGNRPERAAAQHCVVSSVCSGEPRLKRRTLIQAATARLGVDEDRALAAAARFSADVERAATPDGLTMRWDGMTVDGGLGAGRDGPGDRARAAAERLEYVRSAFGEIGFAALLAVLIDGVNASTFSRRYGLDRKSAPARVADMLEALADYYDTTAPRAV